MCLCCLSKVHTNASVGEMILFQNKLLFGLNMKGEGEWLAFVEEGSDREKAI